MQYLDSFYSIIVFLVESDLFFTFFIPLFCLAVCSVVPVLIRFFCFGRR